jgi:CopG family transcriptional regulator/antitoxin EndoAI
MNKRINIILPEKTVNVLDRVTTKGARSRFIDRAILRCVETEGKEALRNQLIAGYTANAARDLEAEIAWFPMEEEAAGGAEALGAEMPIKRL